MNFFKILMVVNAVTQWGQKALEDGKIDSKEALELVTIICGALGLKAEIKL